MDIFHVILDSIKYVTSANMFWSSMGFTTAVAMFVGSLIYQGCTTQAKKGIISVLAYAGMLIWVTSFRLFDTFTDQEIGPIQSQHPEVAFAQLITICFLTVFWLFGIILGITLVHLTTKKKTT